MNENEINKEQAAPQDPAPAEKPRGDKRSPAEIAIAVVAVVLIVAILAAVVMGGLGGSADSGELGVPGEQHTGATGPQETTGETVGETTGEQVEPGTVPADGNADDVTCKGTYTVTDEQAVAEAATVVATLGDQELTNADLQIYYWMQVVSFLNEYGSYASYFGLDHTQPLDTQMSMGEEKWTWQQYFLYCGLDAWACYESLAQEAIASGFAEESEDYQTYAAAVRDDVTASAKEYGYDSIEDMLLSVVGPGSTAEAYFDYLQTYYLGYLYYNARYEALTPSAEKIESYFDKRAESYAENGIEKDDSIYVDVRHILVMPEGGTTDDAGVTTYSDEEWAAAETEAQNLLDQWLSGEATEESFGALADANSDDPGSTNGGLYTYVAEGEMVPNFNDWCFDESRKAGDYGLVKTEYGYHLMYFVDSTPVWYATAESDLLSEIANGIVPDAMEKYEISYDYDAMVLGNVSLS